MQPELGGIDKKWRRGRDSNPRRGYKPLTPLAGERLRPLGHLSTVRITARIHKQPQDGKNTGYGASGKA